MKALEILKELDNDLVLNDYFRNRINEAVAELEQMQENLKASEKILLNLNRLSSDEAKEV